MGAKYAELLIAFLIAIMVSAVFAAAYAFASKEDVRKPVRVGILATVSFIAIAAVVALILS